MDTEEKKKKDREYYQQNKEKIKERVRQYRKNNKEKISSKRSVKNLDKEVLEKKREVGKQRYQQNKEKVLIYQKQRYQQNKEKIKGSVSEYRKNNKEKINDWRRNRRKNDRLFNLMCNYRSRISGILKERGYRKKSKTYQILGCSFEEFKEHLEKQFEPWMNWDNYGKYNGELNFGWDIDHVIPQSSAKTEDELLQLNHYTNLKPLCSYINRDIKRNNL